MATDQATVMHRVWKNTADEYAKAETFCDEAAGNDGLHAAVVEYFDSPFPVPDGELGQLNTFVSASEDQMLRAIEQHGNGREFDIQYETGPLESE